MLFTRWLMLLRGLVGSQHVAFDPTAETAVGAALAEITGYTTGADRMAEITIPQLWHALAEPAEQLVTECRYSSRQHFLDDTRPVRDALGSLVRGHLAGLFDAPTTITVDWRAPIQSLSLSRLAGLGDEAVGVALTCLNSWGRAMTEIAAPGTCGSSSATNAGGRCASASTRSSPSTPTCGCPAPTAPCRSSSPTNPPTCSPSATPAAKPSRSRKTCCTCAPPRSSSAKTPRSATNSPRLLGLPGIAQRIVTDWATAAKGRALWVVGTHYAKVQTLRVPAEIPLTYTNQALSPAAAVVNARDRPSGRSAHRRARRRAACVPAGRFAGLILMLGGGRRRRPPSRRPAARGGGTGQTIAGVALDAEQMGNARTIVAVVAGRHLPVYAAVVAVTTAFTESSLRNSAVHYDHDSEGLFQQRIRYYTAAVADDPVKATNAFLDRLIAIPGWQQLAVGVDAQTVQQSAYPERYQPNAELGAALVGVFWAAAGRRRHASDRLGPTDTVAAAASVHVCQRRPTGGRDRPGGVPRVPGERSPAAGRSSARQATTSPEPPPSRPGWSSPAPPTGADRASASPWRQLGKPYVWAAAGPDAFDCSGLTMAAWAAAGVALPHHAADQTFHGTPEPTDLSHAVGGDLVMIPGADGTPAAPGHVGMIVGYTIQADGRHLWLIQAPETGVPIELTEVTRWAGQIVDVRHIA